MRKILTENPALGPGRVEGQVVRRVLALFPDSPWPRLPVARGRTFMVNRRFGST